MKRVFEEVKINGAELLASEEIDEVNTKKRQPHLSG